MLDAERTTLPLNCTGPSMSDPTKTAHYQDVIEIIDDDHRILRSQMVDDDGVSHVFMEARYTRSKRAKGAKKKAKGSKRKTRTSAKKRGSNKSVKRKKAKTKESPRRKAASKKASKKKSSKRRKAAARR